MIDASRRWTQVGLVRAGFSGFVPFGQLVQVEPPTDAGVYVVVRVNAGPPIFVESSPAGRFKGKDPTVGRELLDTAWVPGSEVLYIGKAGAGRSGRRGLRKRLEEYRRHGEGQPIGHWGGRYIWQLRDAGELLVAWRVTGDESPELVEARMLDDFVGQFGRRPFANRKLGAKMLRVAHPPA